MKAQRYYPPGVVPLELWDALIDGTPLYQLPELQKPSAVACLVQQLRHGVAERLRTGALPTLHVESVVLAGGGPLQDVCAALTLRGIPAAVSAEPAWIAERGGRALLQAFAPGSAGAVVDVGQTAIKYSDRDGRLRLERDLARVPLELDVRDSADARLFRKRAIEFIASAFHQRRAPEALVLALPCEVAQDLTLAGCSYPWPAGDHLLVRQLLHAAQLEHVPCRVLNDAELAAISVAIVHARPRTLVLTLGLGLGAAYLP
jgi:hypothetical protein